MIRRILLLHFGVSGVGVLSGQAPPTARSAQSVQASVSADVGWERNVQMKETDIVGDFVQHARVDISASIKRPRGEFSVLASGEGAAYQTTPSLNRTTYDVGARARRTMSRRLDGGVFASYRTLASTEFGAPAQTIGASPGAPVNQSFITLLPLSLARSVTASADVNTKLSSAMSGTARVDFVSVDFSSASLHPGRTTTATGTLNRRRSAHSSLLATARLQSGITQGVETTTESMAVGFDATKRLGGISVLVGATRIADSLPARVTPSASVNARIGRAHSLFESRYVREVSQAFGLGQTLVTDEAGAVYHYRTRANEVFVSASRSWSSDRSTVSPGLTTTYAMLRLQHSLRSDLSVGTIGFYRSSDGIRRVSGSGIQLVSTYRLGTR